MPSILPFRAHFRAALAANLLPPLSLSPFGATNSQAQSLETISASSQTLQFKPNLSLIIISPQNQPRCHLRLASLLLGARSAFGSWQVASVCSSEEGISLSVPMFARLPGAQSRARPLAMRDRCIWPQREAPGERAQLEIPQN